MPDLSTSFNPYGDKPTFLTQGHGADIASQRADDLDNLALDYITPCCSALDFASGAGGQAARMQARGATVTAIDIADMSAVIPAGIRFLQGDMRHPSLLLKDTTYRVIVWQRAVHYLPFNEASKALQELARHLLEDGKIYISASGINSELGNDYTGRSESATNRYCPLSITMANKHDIYGNVCLYQETDMQQLAQKAGLAVETLFTSTFGNIKCVLKQG